MAVTNGPVFETSVPEHDVYRGDLPTFEWEKYQRGFMGILNNAYNQSCNAGSKKLGQMSEICTHFEERGGGSWDDFVDFYDSYYGGEKRRGRATYAMADNLVDRVESVGGDLDYLDALDWSHKYVWNMLANTYRGFCSEDRAVEVVADEYGVSYTTDVSVDEESSGIDGYLDGTPVQVKPQTYADGLNVDVIETDIVIVYEYDESFDFYVFEQ